MTTIGWHQDPDDPTISRYWDGTGWQGTLVWDGTEWVATDAAPAAVESAATAPAPEITVGATPVEAPAPDPVPAAPPAAAPAAAAAAAGSTTSGLGALSRPAKIIFAGVAVSAVGVVLPWEKISTSFASATDGPMDHAAAAVFLFAFLAGIVALVWGRRESTLSVGRMAGIGVLVAIMLVLGFARMSSIGDAGSDQEQAQAEVGSSPADDFGLDPSLTADLNDLDDLYNDAVAEDRSAGIGLFLWGIGGLVIAGGLVDAFLRRGKGTEATGTGPSSPTTQPF